MDTQEGGGGGGGYRLNLNLYSFTGLYSIIVVICVHKYLIFVCDALRDIAE